MNSESDPRGKFISDPVGSWSYLAIFVATEENILPNM